MRADQLGSTFEDALKKLIRDQPKMSHHTPMPPRKKSAKELEWEAMTDDEKLMAFAKSKLRGAVREDNFRKRRTLAVANFWYDARATYLYGGGDE